VTEPGGLSRRGFIGGAAAGGAAAFVISRFADGDDEARAAAGLVPWDGPRQAGIVTERTEYGVVAAFDIVDDDLARLFADLTARIAELTQGHPDRLDPIRDERLPPSDTGELGYDRRRDGRLTITLGLGASLFDRRFGLRGRRPGALRRMPSFPGDNLDPERSHGDILLLIQSDHLMVTHHALRDVMRRTKGRLQGRWAQPCFQRFAAGSPSTRRSEGVADARGLLGFPDGSQNISPERGALIFAGDEAPEWARGGSYLAVRLIRLKLERWDRLTRTDQQRSIGRHKLSGAPLEGGRERDVPRLGRETPVDAHIRMANPRRPGDERRRFLRRPFVYANGFDEYGLLDSGSVFLGFCRDLEAQFGTVKRRTRGQDLDEYMVAIGGGYFFCPPGVDGAGDYLARRLLEDAGRG
jgi:deferrochelatase/peroxidase EfeB